MKFINIPVSQVSSLIGLNRYASPSETLLDIWKKVDLERIGKIQDFYETKIESLEEEVESLLSEKERLQKTIISVQEKLRKTPSSSPANVTLKRALDELEEELSIVEFGLSTNVTTIELSRNVKRTRTARDIESEIVSKNKNVVNQERSLEENLSKVSETISKIEDPEEQRATRAALTSVVRKSHGTRTESSAIDLYCREFNTHITQPKENIVHNILKNNEVTINLIGRIDGLCHLNDTEYSFIEVKNRTNRLFKVIPEYEEVQVLLYKMMYNQHLNKKCVSAELVECYKGKINAMKCEDPDNSRLNLILHRLAKIVIFVSQLLTDDIKAADFLKLSKEQRDGLIVSQ
jgi:vacuolar-type H+-ATPase subunit I/STV1